MLNLHFRSSSHSDDVTVIATFATNKAAKEVVSKLSKFIAEVKANREQFKVDWNPDEVELFIEGKQVEFHVYTVGYLDEVDTILNSGKPKKNDCYINVQVLEITVTIPKGLTPKTVALVMSPEEAKVLLWLEKNIGKPSIREVNGQSELKWNYYGNGIWYGSTLAIDGHEFQLDEHPNWSVNYV